MRVKSLKLVFLSIVVLGGTVGCQASSQQTLSQQHSPAPGISPSPLLTSGAQPIKLSLADKAKNLDTGLATLKDSVNQLKDLNTKLNQKGFSVRNTSDLNSAIEGLKKQQEPLKALKTSLKTLSQDPILSKEKAIAQEIGELSQNTLELETKVLQPLLEKGLRNETAVRKAQDALNNGEGVRVTVDGSFGFRTLLAIEKRLLDLVAQTSEIAPKVREKGRQASPFISSAPIQQTQDLGTNHSSLTASPQSRSDRGSEPNTAPHSGLLILLLVLTTFVTGFVSGGLTALWWFRSENLKRAQSNRATRSPQTHSASPRNGVTSYPGPSFVSVPANPPDWETQWHEANEIEQPAPSLNQRTAVLEKPEVEMAAPTQWTPQKLQELVQETEVNPSTIVPEPAPNQPSKEPISWTLGLEFTPKPSEQREPK